MNIGYHTSRATASRAERGMREDHASRRSKSSRASLYFMTFRRIFDESTHVTKSSMLRVT
eukprot:2079997-Rhodomonas_salina.1